MLARARKPIPRSPWKLALPAAVAAIVIAGCGSDGGTVRAKNAPRVSTAGVPRPLARNIGQANTILDGKGDLLKRKLTALRGYPVVVNQWASWCDPCRFEFPFFQAEAKLHKKDVAFLGIDMQDNKGDARKFLEDIPSLFPSIFDPDASYITSLGGGRASPTTVFVGRNGDVLFVHVGAYASQSAVEADIRRYAGPGQKS
jgi:cytochrome c biogenesis protein CcmG/thiol:disulfide interchange protein DsbE